MGQIDDHALETRILLMQDDIDRLNKQRAGALADLAQAKNRAERAEFLLQGFQPGPLGDPNAERIEVHWPHVEQTVVVDGFFEHIGRDLWDIAIDAVWLRGADITVFLEDKSARASLDDAIDRKLTADRVEAVQALREAA